MNLQKLTAILAAVPLLVLGEGAIAQTSIEQRQFFPAIPNGECICDTNDPFDPKARMPKGRFQGQCINSCQQRSVRVLSAQESAPYGVSEGIRVANVSHNGKFWVAQIPFNAIEDVIYQIEYFPASVPAAHTQLRFRFRAGSEPLLTPQIPDANISPVRLRDIVYSVEAVGLPETNFDLVGGFLDRFAIAYRMVSLEDRAQRMIFIDKHRVEQVKLNLQPQEKESLLNNAIAQGDRAGLTTMYNTLALNCTTELFRAIDQSIVYDTTRQQPQGEIFVNLPTGEQISSLIQNQMLNPEALNDLLSSSLEGTRLEFLKQHIPTISKDALQRRQILGEQMPDLNEELTNSNIW